MKIFFQLILLIFMMSRCSLNVDSCNCSETSNSLIYTYADVWDQSEFTKKNMPLDEINTYEKCYEYYKNKHPDIFKSKGDAIFTSIEARTINAF